MKKLVVILALTFTMVSAATVLFAKDEFKIVPKDYANTGIVCAGGNIVTDFAAKELQKHLALITGFKFPVSTTKGSLKKVFYVGAVPSSDTKKLESEEARYLVTKDSIYLYGEDNIPYPGKTDYESILMFQQNRTGTLFAVYNFLEFELGVHWIEPGDAGIVYEPNKSLTVPVKSASWVSHFTYDRGFRLDFAGYDEDTKANFSRLPKEFQYSDAQNTAVMQDTLLWEKRMRMGNRSKILKFGHAFTDWWGKYGKDHPEFFALTGRGKREPISMREVDRTKMCPSNLALADQIVAEYVKNPPKNGEMGISGCEDDAGSFGLDEWCHCVNCEALDYLKPGEKFGDNLTDRYVYLWNNVLDRAKKIDPNVTVDGYVYEQMINPPRVQRLHDGIVLKYVTRFNDDFDFRTNLYEGWNKMGAKTILFRPNDMGCDTGLPMGVEKRMFDNLDLALKYGAQGTDYDALKGFFTGCSELTYYTIAKKHVDTSKPFEYWENEYVSMFGPAKEDIRSFYKYWREEVMDKRLQPADQKNRDSGGIGFLRWHGCAEYCRRVDKYYSDKDFDITDQYLRAAKAKKLNPVQKRLVERMVIANVHNRLTYRAMLAREKGTPADSAKAAGELVKYRIAHKGDLWMNWPNLFDKQAIYGDACGITAFLKSQATR